MIKVENPASINKAVEEAMNAEILESKKEYG